MSRTLRVSVPPAKKGAKQKPAIDIVWDGEGSALAAVQADRRAKTVKSLRRETGEEYTQADLHVLPQQTVILGSPRPSELPPIEVQVALSHLPNLETQESSAAAAGPKRESSVWNKARAREDVPCSPDKASRMMYGGAITSLNRQVRGVRAWYNENTECFELTGDPAGIRRAKLHLNQECGMAQSTIRVPSPTDVVGHVIGKEGRVINAIKHRLMLSHVAVEWDAEDKVLVVSTAHELTEATRAELFREVQKIVDAHSEAPPS